MSDTAMRKFAFFFLSWVSLTANAIVIRDDVDDSRYRVSASELPALADLPGEGHGVLIAPQWVLTAAHAVSWQMSVDEVTLNGIPRKVERLVIYPGYHTLPQALVDAALKSGDASAIISYLAASDDVALVKLAQPVTDVAPVALYTGSDELGKIVELLGKGATGTGATGQDPHGSHRTQLRRAYNRIIAVEDRWLCLTFHKPPAALPLEGITGDGDSGGPLLLKVGDRWQVAGLASWKRGKDNAILLHPGFYGQTTYNVRVSHYAAWIKDVVSK